MNIGFDLDDTIAHHEKNKLSLARKHISGDITTLEEMITAYEPLDFSPEHYRAFRDELYGELSLTADIMDGCHENINKLIADDNHIFIVSRREKKTRQYATTWVKKHLPHIYEDDIFFVDNDAEKGRICAGLDISIFLDDKKEVLRHLPLSIRPVLFDNQNKHMNTPYQRVLNWKEFHLLYTTIKNMSPYAPLCV